MKKLLQKKVFNFVTLDRLFGTLVMYFLVVGIAWTVQYFGDRQKIAEQREAELAQQELILAEIAKPASDYIEYLSIQPTQPVFDVIEDIKMTSHTIRKRSAFIHWNDILYCDANADGTFAFIYSSESSKYANVKKISEQKKEWFFVEPSIRLPRVPEAQCYILSEQQICPPELAEVEGVSCKIQEIKSGEFTVLNRNQQ